MSRDSFGMDDVQKFLDDCERDDRRKRFLRHVTVDPDTGEVKFACFYKTTNKGEQIRIFEIKGQNWIYNLDWKNINYMIKKQDPEADLD